jgi:NADH dehydrogenase
VNVFVTGATGFVGREILRQLHGAGHAVRILARDAKARRVREVADRLQAEVCEGNVLDAVSLSGGLSGVGAVIHLVGAISEVGQNTFENIHVRGTGNIVAAAQKAGVRRFVHMSALGTRPNAASRYHQSKWTAEEIVRRSGLDWTIFRPSIIYGPDDAFVNLFARIARLSPVLPVMGTGQSKFQPVRVEDVAACFIGALTEPRSVGKTFDVCGAETFTLTEILDLVLAVTGRKRLKLRVPLRLARGQAALLEFVFPRLLRKAPPLNRDQLVMLQEENIGDANPAMELFGIKSSSFREGIACYLRRNP